MLDLRTVQGRARCGYPSYSQRCGQQHDLGKDANKLKEEGSDGEDVLDKVVQEGNEEDQGNQLQEDGGENGDG